MGKMDGEQLERVMSDFIDGAYDVLVATTIIESGIDISNANTILINEAHTFGLSDLHPAARSGRSVQQAGHSVTCWRRPCTLCPPNPASAFRPWNSSASSAAA